MLRPLRIALIALAAAALVAACSPSAASPPASSDPVDVTITARDLKFGQTSVQAPAGRPFTILFDNQESAPHNVTIARDTTFASPLFQGEIVSSRQITYSVPALQAGTYAFRCDVHPEMVGSLVAQ